MTGEKKSHYDVVIVGAGGAGLAAAIEAADYGASVVVLEKNPQPGGSTWMSLGAMTAAGTKHQIRKGIHDDIDAFREDMDIKTGPLAGKDNPEMKDILVRNLKPTMEWLESLGVAFIGPFPEGSHRVPRMHSVIPSGKAFIHALTRAARKRKVDIFCSMRVVDLVKARDGRVCGVQCETDTSMQTFRAEAGVVLTTGDFSANIDLKKKYYEPDVSELQGLNPTSTGDGHTMGERAGGTLLNMSMNTSMGLRFPPPPQGHFLYRWESLLLNFPCLARLVAWIARYLPARIMQPFLRMVLTCHMAPEAAMYRNGCILVNAEGKRFTNEVVSYTKEVVNSPVQLVTAVARQPEHKAYLILDARLARYFSEPPHGVSTAPGVGWALFSDYQRSRSEIVYEGNDWEELAGKTGFSTDILKENVKTFNQAMQGYIPDPFGRQPTNTTLSEPPYYAMGPLIAYQQTTKGGLKVNANFQVLDNNDQVIPGLYAAGYTGLGGLLLAGHGVSVGWAFLSGRIAGRHAAGQTR